MAISVVVAVRVRGDRVAPAHSAGFTWPAESRSPAQLGSGQLFVCAGRRGEAAPAARIDGELDHNWSSSLCLTRTKLSGESREKITISVLVAAADSGPPPDGLGSNAK